MTIERGMENKLKISQTLTEMLERHQMSMTRLSKLSGIPVSSLSEWKKNNRNPNAEDLAKVSRALDCSVHYLLFGVEDPSEPIQRVLKEEFFKGTFEITLKRVKVKGDKE